MRPSLIAPVVVLASLATLLSACGGGDAAPAAAAQSNSLAGTVAVGAPITNGRLRILDATGAVVASDIVIAADGSYPAVTLTGPAPWRLEACGNAGANYLCVYSVAVAAGTANVTPLTTATVLLASGAPPATLMNGATPTLTGATIAEAQSQLRTGLAGVLGDAGVGAGFDFVSGALAAGSRTGYDRVLDAVGVSTGQDTQAFVQITPRLGTGNLYLERGTSSGSVAVAAGTAALSLTGIETLFRNMSDAVASPTACSHPTSGLRSQLAMTARMQMGPDVAMGAEQVALALCGFFAEGEGGGTPMWGARLLSPTLGRCETAGANPLCRVSFVMQSIDGDVHPVGNGMAVTQEAGTWKFVGGFHPIELQANARLQRDVRVDGTAPVESFTRALAFEVPALPGLLCARVSQRDQSAQVVTIGYYKRHAGPDVERLSLWTDGFGNGANLNPLMGATRSGDDTWIGLPEGMAGDSLVRNFYRGGRSVTFSLYNDIACSMPFLLDGQSEFEVEVEGVPPVWASLATMAWPVLDAASVASLRALSLAANATASLATAWEFPRGVVAVDEATFCSDRGTCGQGGAGRLASQRFRPGSRSTTLNLVNGPTAVAATNSKMIALYGRTGDGMGMQSNFMSCTDQPAGMACR